MLLQYAIPSASLLFAHQSPAPTSQITTSVSEDLGASRSPKASDSSRQQEQHIAAAPGDSPAFHGGHGPALLTLASLAASAAFAVVSNEPIEDGERSVHRTHFLTYGHAIRQERRWQPVLDASRRWVWMQASAEAATDARGNRAKNFLIAARLTCYRPALTFYPLAASHLRPWRAV